MTKGKQQLKFLFERNPRIRYKDKLRHERTGGRTNFDFMSTADIVKQS